MTNGVKTRLLTPYVMICRIRKKKCTLRSSEEKPSGAQRGSARLRAARQTGPEATERLRLAQTGSESREEAESGSSGLTEAPRGSERLGMAERCPDGPRVVPRGSNRVRAALSSSARPRDVQVGPERPREAQSGRKAQGKQKSRILRGTYHDKWCQTSSFDIICHDM